jgi:hypothetical protein
MSEDETPPRCPHCSQIPDRSIESITLVPLDAHGTATGKFRGQPIHWEWRCPSCGGWFSQDDLVYWARGRTG